MKRLRDYDPEQPYLLPPAPTDWLPAGHLAFFVHELVQQLDLSSVYADYAPEVGGRPPLEPRMMVAVWIYAYAVGVRSSRKVQAALVEDVAFRFQSGNQQPAYWALNRFRTRHRQALSDLFAQSVRLAVKAGLVKLGHVAIDGSKLQANASKNKAMSYARMQAEEQRLQREISDYLDECDEVDAAEDDRFGEHDGRSLPEHLQRPADRLAAIRKAMRELEEEAEAQEAERQERKRREAEAAGKAYKPRKDPAEVEPEGKTQRNFTDPESRIMLSGKAIVQGYNVQIAVDAANQIILATTLTNQAADTTHLPGLLNDIHRNTGRYPKEVSADAGYYSETNITAIQETGAMALVAPGRLKHDEWRSQKAPRGRKPKNLTRRQEMKRFLSTKVGKAKYSLRQVTAEPVFGQTKFGRGLRQVLHRGLEKNRCFWNFDAAVHNLLKVLRHARHAIGSPNPA